MKGIMKSIKRRMRRIYGKLISLLPNEWRGKFLRYQLKLNQVAPDSYVFKVANTAEELEAAFKLLHNVYVDTGYMLPHPSGLRVSFYHALPSTTTLVVKKGDLVVGTLSVIRDSPVGLPLESDFDISFLRNGRFRIAEASSFAIKKECRGHTGLKFALIKYFFEYCHDYFGIDYLVCAVNPKQSDFYEQILLFDKLGDTCITNYGFANGAPAVAKYFLLKDYPMTYAKVYGLTKPEKNLYSYLSPSRYGGVHFNYFEFPDRIYNTLSDPVMKPKILQEFFIEKTGAFHELSPHQERLIHSLYRDWQKLLRFEIKHRSSFIARERRHDVNCSAQIVGRGHLTRVPMDILNVSRSGLCGYLKKAIPIGEKVQLKISLSQFSVVTLKVQTVWNSSNNQYGFAILDYDENWDHFITELDKPYQLAG